MRLHSPHGLALCRTKPHLLNEANHPALRRAAGRLHITSRLPTRDQPSSEEADETGSKHISLSTADDLNAGSHPCINSVGTVTPN